MSAVETGQMSAAGTGQLSTGETRHMFCIETRQSPVARVDNFVVLEILSQ